MNAVYLRNNSLYILHMKYSLQTEHIDITEGDQALIDEKMDRIEKYVSVPFVADMRIVKDQHHTTGDVIMCKVNISQGKKVIHADRTAGTVQNAVDETINALQSELRREHDKKKEDHS